MIEILNVRPLTGSGTVQAFVDFRVNEKLTVYGAKVIKQDGQAAWVAMPDRSYQVDGQTKYISVVRIDDPALKEKIQQAILSAYEAEDAA